MTPVLTDPHLARLDGVIHGFFTREGGVSEGVFGSLNAGFGAGDDPDRVTENRALAARALGAAPERLATGRQVHSAEVAVIDGAVGPSGAPRADGFVTARPGVLIGILSADCAPVLLADAEARVVGAAHAGWRGALAGIAEATVAAMERLGARRARMVAAVGPCIGKDSYDVGPEFPGPFLADDPGAGRFFAPAPRAGNFRFDLEGYVAARLRRLGLAGVAGLGLDTCALEDRFFSYRRAVLRREAHYGRALSAIALAE